ncbi:MAG: hypothetical protein H7325_13120 [Pedobacter sp.]|nr:hypothetical protein [Pedobacter sp.]
MFILSDANESEETCRSPECYQSLRTAGRALRGNVADQRAQQEPALATIFQGFAEFDNPY